MSVISFAQEHQGLLIIGAFMAAFALYRFFTRKSSELEELEREYQEILQAGKQMTTQRAFTTEVKE